MKMAIKKLQVILLAAFSLGTNFALHSTEYALLPAEKEGLFPIEIPIYKGVDQLLLLSSQWVIVVTTNTKEVLDKINELTDGEFYRLTTKWENKSFGNFRDWTSKKAYEKLYKEHIATARTLCGELDLDKTSYYEIQSDQDANYQDKRHPKRATRAIVSLDKGFLPGEYHVHYAQYSYLEFPTPMESGKRYVISLQNGKTVSFVYDEKKSISRAIKVNQVGYLPQSKKYAYVGAYLQEFGPLEFAEDKQFSVISASTGKVVLRGPMQLRVHNPHVQPKPNSHENALKKPLLTGEKTYELDLSSLEKEGEFFISIPGIGRSWTFKHSKDVYGEAFYIAARGLYHQRCGIAIGKPFTSWPRIQCHTSPVYGSESIPFAPNIEVPKKYNNFNVIAASIDYQKVTKDATGGWHDASDWDRNIYHYTNILDLLNMYAIAPEKFSDQQLNIPESGDGIPDILNEAEYGLRPWKKSMGSDFGVSGSIETWTHPTIDDPKVKYAYSQKTKWASLLYAGTAAQLARLIKPFSIAIFKEYEQSAIKAYSFGKDEKNLLKNITIHAAEDRGKGMPYTISWSENEKDDLPYLIFAKIQLYLLTDEKRYIEDIIPLLKKTLKPYEWRFSIRDFSPWLYFGLFSEKFRTVLLPSEIAAWKKIYVQAADEYTKIYSEQPYRQSWPIYKNFWMGWGNATMTNQARALFIAYWLSGKEKYKQIAIFNVDYMLGANPMGMSWTTGLGFCYPIAIQHAVSEDDAIKDPVPGITIYGNGEEMFHDLKYGVWQVSLPGGEKKNFLTEANWNVPLFRRWGCHPHVNTPQCEFTIHETMSSTIFACAMLMNTNWKPSDQLKQKLPRKENLLFGYWYLP